MENKLFELGYKFVPYTISRNIFNQEQNPCYIKMKWEEKIEKYIVLNEEKTKIVDSGIVIGRFLNQQLVPLNEEEFNQAKKVMKDLKKELKELKKYENKGVRMQ